MFHSRSNSGVAHYAFKDKVREYLEEINKSEKVRKRSNEI